MRLFDTLIARNMIPSEYRSVPRFVFDNVSDYYYQHDREYWRMPDFPNPMPTFERLWAEWHMPTTIRSNDAGKVDATWWKGCRSGVLVKPGSRPFWWDAMLLTVWTDGDKIINGGSQRFGFRLSPEEPFIQEVTVDTDHELTIHQVASELYALHPMFMGFSLMHCNNVEVVRVYIPHKLKRVRMRRNKPELHSYRVVHVLPMNVHKKVERSIELGSDASIGQVAIRRGSYATYGPRYGHGLLFGKYEGVYWRPGIVKQKDATYGIEVDKSGIL
jgi:hypothetical protein